MKIKDILAKIGMGFGAAIVIFYLILLLTR